MVGVEQTYYTVSEDVGVVELCIFANSTCSYPGPFNISLSTSAGSAGMIIICVQLAK